MRKIKNPTKYWKNKAWEAFSAYIRQRNADVYGFNSCVTCKEERKVHWKELQAGHFVSGRNNTVLFDERLVHPQCGYCNVILKGNMTRYFIYMKTKGYTDEQIIEFDNLKFMTKKMSWSDFKDIFDKYKAWL